MSFLTDLGRTVSKAVGDIGREAGRAVRKVAPVAQFVPGLNLVTSVAGGVANLASAVSPAKRRGGAVAFPGQPVFSQGPSTNQLLPAVAGPLGSVVGRVAGRVAPVLFGSAAGSIGGDIIRAFTPGGGTSGGCGCNGSSGRDPCTRQKMTSQPAPNATLFGGCCPPGRTLRRISLGRDICIKTPKMNPFNPRALARADRRVTTFARRAAPILKDMGFTVSSTRRVKIAKKKRSR